MPIGKDSITKRVAKTDVTQETEINSESKNEEKPVTVPKKRTSAKKTVAKTSSDTTAGTNDEITKLDVQSNVLANVDSETVEKVIGHKEGSDSKKVSIGDDMPFYLM